MSHWFPADGAGAEWTRDPVDGVLEGGGHRAVVFRGHEQKAAGRVNFGAHLQLDEIVDIAREASDTVAERMRALDAVPDARSDTVVASTTLPAFPPAEQNTTETVDLITTRIYATVGTIRRVHDAVDAVDPSTSDLLHEIIDSLEKQAWMLKSENRKV